ncbi:MAG: hypothetical protein QOD53_600 [Thermoleophilaceae bacterium]|nr:hypothetical protein [Thermoleophilaceae bacterium]
MLGIYLGDGHIARHPRNVYRLTVSLDSRYPSIIHEASTAIHAVRPDNSVYEVHRPGRVEVASYSKAWPCLLPQHGPGKKHERRIVIEAWQRPLIEARPELLLRGLIHSDGWRSINTGRGGWRHPRYSFSNRSLDILGIFRMACDLLALRWTTTRHTVYVSRKADVARMDEFVGPKS